MQFTIILLDWTCCWTNSRVAVILDAMKGQYFPNVPPRVKMVMQSAHEYYIIILDGPTWEDKGINHELYHQTRGVYVTEAIAQLWKSVDMLIVYILNCKIYWTILAFRYKNLLMTHVIWPILRTRLRTFATYCYVFKFTGRVSDGNSLN